MEVINKSLNKIKINFKIKKNYFKDNSLWHQTHMPLKFIPLTLTIINNMMIMRHLVTYLVNFLSFSLLSQNFSLSLFLLSIFILMLSCTWWWWKGRKAKKSVSWKSEVEVKLVKEIIFFYYQKIEIYFILIFC